METTINITANARAQAEVLLGNTLSVKRVTKAISKQLRDQRELDRFMSGNFEADLPANLRPANLDKTIDGILEPARWKHHGLANVEKMQTLLSAITEELIQPEIDARAAFIATFALNPEQEKIAAAALDKYAQFLRGYVLRIMANKLRIIYGLDPL